MNRLEDNFREIYHAVRFPSEQALPLVANISGTRIYDSGCFWGRIWVWIYDFVDFFSSYPWYSEKLQQATQHTNALFFKTLDSIESHISNYAHHLQQCGKGYPFPADLCLQAKDQITRWNDSTKPLIKFIKNVKTTSHPVVKLLQESFFAQAEKIQALHAYQDMIDLEGYCAAPMPYFILKKMLRNIPLNTLDQKEIKKWVNKLNKNSIPIKTIHQSLQAIVNFYTAKKPTERLIRDPLAALKLSLEEIGCKIFQQDDPKHLKWRQGLKNGSSIALKHAEIILGDEIFPGLSGSDRTRAYMVKEMPNQIALIGNNTSVLPIRNLRMHQANVSILPTACFNEISPCGKVALMERLRSPSEFKWTSFNDMISEEDAPIVLGIATLIQKMIHQNVTPTHFASSTMFDSSFQFKSIKPISMLPFDFNVIEDFIKECSCGNETIFRKLMTASGLRTHPAANFYREIVSNTLNNEKMAISDLAAIYKIGDSKIVDKATLLAEQVNAAKKQLLPELRKLHSERHFEWLNHEANQRILQQYVQQYKV